MTYQEQYNKLIAHAERFESWAKMQNGMAISRPSESKGDNEK